MEKLSLVTLKKLARERGMVGCYNLNKASLLAILFPTENTNTIVEEPAHNASAHNASACGMDETVEQLNTICDGDTCKIIPVEQIPEESVVKPKKVKKSKKVIQNVVPPSTVKTYSISIEKLGEDLIIKIPSIDKRIKLEHLKQLIQVELTNLLSNLL